MPTRYLALSRAAFSDRRAHGCTGALALRLWRAAVLLWVTTLALVGPAGAAGFGDSGTSAVLGQPLDFAVQLRLDVGEVPSPECVSAEVTAGDRRLLAQQVRTQLTTTGPDTARVRVFTLVALDEPVVVVLLQVGCQTRMTRRFVVLADPPVIAASAQAVTAPVMGNVPLVLPMAAPPGPRTGTDNGTDTPSTSPLAGGGAPVGAVSGTTAGTQPAARAAPRSAAVRPVEPKRAPVAQRATQQPRGQPTRQAAAAAAARPAVAARANSEPGPARPASPRLKLDMLDSAPTRESVAVEQALIAVAQAASATRAAASAAMLAERRIAAMETTVDQLRAEAKASRELAAQMRERLSRQEASSPWLWPLAIGVLLLAGLAAWMAREMQGLRRAQQATWQQAAAGARRAQVQDAAPSRQPTSPIPFVTSEVAMPSLAQAPAKRASTPAWPPPSAAAMPASAFAPDTAQHPTIASDSLIQALAESGADTSIEPHRDEASMQARFTPRDTLYGMQRTMPMPAPLASVRLAAGDAGSPRDVTIEELIDLEQQAEFFVVLGQDEAAVDLLVEHLRSTGGGSPLPYLKLLEIHHRRGDRDAYDRTRGRFNHRFNAYAPEWEVGLLHGRSIEDYAGIVPRLQQVWPRPLDAMAELEALLFRKSRGDLFDLPAYRDVLFLYSLARDLLDREAANTGAVDLLLPLADGGEFGSTGAHPYFGAAHDSVFDDLNSDDMPTAPVDLDLTSSNKRTSIFDPLQARPFKR